MRKYLIKFFGLKGSWKWAVMQMRMGKLIRPKRATGTIKYRFSNDGQNRIEMTFDRKDFKWENANIFYSDLIGTDWTIYKAKE